MTSEADTVATSNPPRGGFAKLETNKIDRITIFARL
jgi:hypothetical protein